MTEDVLIKNVLFLLNQIKLYHWSTTSYAKHKALDDLHSTLSEKTDLLVESYIGKYKRQPLKNFTINLTMNTDVNQLVSFIESQRALFVATNFSTAKELKNIIDEIVIELDKTLYLLNLE